MLSPSMVFIPEALSRTPSRSSFNWQEGVGPDNAHRQSCLQKQLCADAARHTDAKVVYEFMPFDANVKSVDTRTERTCSPLQIGLGQLLGFRLAKPKLPQLICLT